MKSPVLFLLFFVLLVCTTWSNNLPGRHYHATRLTVPPPTIDGVLDDHAWTTGVWSGEFTQFEPFNGRPPSEQTEFMILYDDDNIYVAIRAWDSSPDSIVSRLTRRDQNDGDNVAIGFDSYNDQRTAFIFGVTAGGVKFDFIMTNDGHNEDWSWDPNWWVRTGIDENGWVAEMRIPLSQLRFEKGGEGVWGLQLARQLYRRAEMSLWSHMLSDTPGIVHCFGKLVGLEDVEPRSIFDITPYAVSSASRYPAVEGNPFLDGRDSQYKFGLDAKIGLTNHLTLDLTINPDFGQVETDPSEVNLTAYETFFQEKRPFFIEGRDITRFNLGIGDGDVGNDNLFYSRRIGRRPQGQLQLGEDAVADIPQFTNILGAAKVTGKTSDGLSVAFINAVTAEEKAEISLMGTSLHQTVEPLTNFFVGRLQKDYSDGTTIIGGMFTGVHRQLDENLADQMHSAAYSGGIDYTRYFRDKTWMFSMHTAISLVRGNETSMLRTQRSPARYFHRPDAGHLGVDSTMTSMTGTGGKIELSKIGGGHWMIYSALTWKSPGFDINDAGYFREADQALQVFALIYRVWEPKGIYRNYNIGIHQYTLWNFNGKNLVTGWNINGSIRYRNYWSSNAGIEFNHGMISTNLLRGGPSFRMPHRWSSWYSTSTDSRKKLVLNINGNLSRGSEDSSDLFRIGTGLTYRPTGILNISWNPYYMKRRESMQYITLGAVGEQSRYVFGSITQEVVSFSFRLNFTLLPDLSLQYWGQPFVATGHYSDFKYVTNPMASRFSDRYAILQEDQIQLIDEVYHVDENRDGTTDYLFVKPDFRFKEFLSNLVIRWEYSPGSTLHLVWSQNRSGYEIDGSLSYLRDLDELFTEKPHNIFLLKFTYRIGVR